MEAIKHLKNVDIRLSKLIDSLGILELKPADCDSFHFLIREIIGQMISVRIRKIIYNRLLNLCKGHITPEVIANLSEFEIKSIGVSLKKACYMKWLAENVINKKIDFDKISALNDTEAINELKKINGIGIWTAKMYLIFYLNRKDILPKEDKAFMQGFKWLYNEISINERVLNEICNRWKPYSSVAALYMYSALDSGLTKIPVEKILF